MNCNETRKLFSEAFDSRLETEALMRFQTHVKGCADCDEEYAQYAGLFAAVAALPELENDRPVPFPETARAFKKPEFRVSLGQRLIRIAALLIVLCGIGWMAFDAGRRESNSNELEEQPMAALDPSKIVMPDLSAQRQLRVIYDRARNYGTLVEVAPAYPDSSVTRLVDHAGRELQTQCKEFVTLPAQQLGTFSTQLRRTASNLDSLCMEVEHILGAQDATDLRLKRSRDLVRVRDLGNLMAPIRNFARSAPESEMPEPEDGDVYGIALAGIDQLVRRDAPRATLYFDRARNMPGFSHSELNNMVQHFESFIQLEVVGDQVGQLHAGHAVPQSVLEILRRHLMTPSDIWITGSADRELRFSTNQNSSQPRTIIIRRQGYRKVHSVEIKIDQETAPEPSSGSKPSSNRKL